MPLSAHVIFNSIIFLASVLYQPVIQTSGGTECSGDNGSSVDKTHNGCSLMPQRHSSTMLTESNCHSTAPTFTRLNKSTLFPSFSLQKSLKWNIVNASESLMLIYSRGIYTAWALEGSLNQMRTNFTLFKTNCHSYIWPK